MGDITWNDTPGETLPSRSESIDFVAARRVNEIRAVYDEEYAYKTDGNGVGSFQPGFEGSTISGDGKTVALRRTTGWNRRVRIYPEIAASAGVNPGWDLLYDVDWSTYPTADILWYSGGPGSNPYVSPVDGHSWNLVARYNNDNDYSIRSVNGQGLVLKGGGGTFPASTGSLCCCVHTPFSTLPGRVSGRDVAIAAEFSFSGSMGNGGNLLGVGMFDWANFTGNVTSSIGADAALYQFGSSIRRISRNNLPESGSEPPSNLTYNSPAHLALLVQQQAGRAQGFITAPTWPGHFPAFAEMRAFSDASAPSLNDTQLAAACTGGGVFVGGGANGSANAVTIKRIQFWQRQS